jgi:hypothetical protein
MTGPLGRARRRLLSAVPPRGLQAAAAVRHGETPAQVRLREALLGWRSRSQLSPTGEADAPVVVGSIAAPVVALTAEPGLRADAVLGENLALVLDALEGDAVPYAVLEAATMRRRVVVVTADSADRARSALARALADRPVYVQAVSGDRAVGRPVPARDVARHRATAGADVLRVFTVRAAGGTVLAGEELGCDLELWPLVDRLGLPRPDGGVHEPGTALAPRPNRWAAYLTPAQRAGDRTAEQATAVVDGRRVRTCPGLLEPHLLDVHFPVDVVYTWVDGSDPAWAARKAAALAAAPSASALHELAANPSRWASRDELRYSLRSLEMYAGWVRRIHLVTDGQVPSWLDTSDPRVQVVDHRELFGETGRLPTFNSHAIESRLHRVPGLAEHFLYLNDDVFFGRPVAPELFFLGNGLARFFLTGAFDLGGPAAADLPVVAAAKRNRDLVAAAFGRRVTQKLQHVAHPQLRSVLAEIEERFPDEVARTAAAQFRSADDVSVPASLAHHYAFATGRAVPGTLAYRYLDIAAERAPLSMRRLLRLRDADVFCLNDVAGSPDSTDLTDRVQTFLEAYFPVPSSLEKTPPQDDAAAGRP